MAAVREPGSHRCHPERLLRPWAALPLPNCRQDALRRPVVGGRGRGELSEVTDSDSRVTVWLPCSFWGPRFRTGWCTGRCPEEAWLEGDPELRCHRARVGVVTPSLGYRQGRRGFPLTGEVLDPWEAELLCPPTAEGRLWSLAQPQPAHGAPRTFKKSWVSGPVR